MATNDSKEIMRASTLAKLVSQQVLAAHNEVAMDVLDTLWADLEIRKEIERRVLSQERKNEHGNSFSLLKTSHVALIGVQPLDDPRFPTASHVDTVLVPAHKLPKWLFVLLHYWVEEKLLLERPYFSPGGYNPKSNPWQRDGLGGLWLHLPSCETLLQEYDALHMRNPTLLPEMLDALELDPLQNPHDTETWAQKNASVRAMIAQERAQGELDDSWLPDLEYEMALWNAGQQYLPTPVVTLVFDYEGWLWR